MWDGFGSLSHLSFFLGFIGSTTNAPSLVLGFTQSAARLFGRLNVANRFLRWVHLLSARSQVASSCLTSCRCFHSSPIPAPSPATRLAWESPLELAAAPVSEAELPETRARVPGWPTVTNCASTWSSSSSSVSVQESRYAKPRNSLNLPWFAPIYLLHFNTTIYLDLPKFTLICLNLHLFASIYLDLPLFTLILPQFTLICHNLHWFTSMYLNSKLYDWMDGCNSPLVSNACPDTWI